MSEQTEGMGWMLGTLCKLAVMELECLVPMFLEKENFAGALQACADMVPLMTKYMDRMEGREQKVIDRWKACLDRTGYDFSQVSK